ncbi:Protein SKT5 [Choanephora cucurbitarum]|uniref:Protein SKT5 n=1 Tax=Choanephora cucurbitarum TaxID=101091 RepID=A0A1C7NP45_9FUNG|nr:Protein SKT5 [Choanephora cucurbitarum]
MASENPVLLDQDIVNIEYRERNKSPSQQWYFDEFSGIYRQNVGHLNQSLSQCISSNRSKHEPIAESRNSFVSQRQTLFGLDFSIKDTLSAQSIKGDDDNNNEPWPEPTTVEEVYELIRKARASQNRYKQLDLCRMLMEIACRSETPSFVTASPIPGTPRVNTRYREQELRRKKKDDLILDEVLVLEAQKILKRLALGGGIGQGTDGDAQFLLANCYGVGGLGLTLNRERAFSLYIQAAKQNHIESIYRAGVCYETGIGTRKDHQRAVIYYRKAASLSHAVSMYKLGIICLRGFCNHPIQIREGLNWLQRAASAKCPDALYALSTIHFSKEFSNTHLVPDISYAMEMLHESAKLNHVPSQVKLGEMYETGNELVEADDALSIYWYTCAAEQGSADAALALSSWFLTGSTDILDQSDQEAYLWARKAASCQNADRWTLAKAFFLVGMYTEKGIGASDVLQEDVSFWYRRAAALGHLGAIKMLENLL